MGEKRFYSLSTKRGWCCALPQSVSIPQTQTFVDRSETRARREREYYSFLETTKRQSSFSFLKSIKSNVFPRGANGPAHAAVPRGGETQSGVQRSGRATRERVLREVRDVAEREIDELRSDVFEQLRAEIHGKRTSDPEQDATRIILGEEEEEEEGE